MKKIILDYEFLKKIKSSVTSLSAPFIFSVTVYILSLLFNTSFHIMGVDIRSEIGSFFKGEYLLLILETNLKIFFVYFIFFSSLGILFRPYTDKFNLSKKYVYFSFIAFTVIILFHSIIKYPQLYGEFFYYRHTYLKPLLYFLTDYFSLNLISIPLLGILSVFYLHILYNFFKLKEYQFYIHGIFSFLFLYFHLQGNIIGVAVNLAIYEILQKQDFKISFNLKILSAISIVFLYIFPLIRDMYFDISVSKNINFPNLIIISADSLRYDKIGILNNRKGITPNIDNLAKESYIFLDHHTTIPRTFPSWGDLLTGEYSMSHKVRDMFPSSDEKKNIGSNRFPTIGHYLKKKNFRTGVVSNFAGDIFPRADFGFDEVLAPTFNAKTLAVQRILESQLFLLPILSGSFFGGEYLSEVRGFSTLGDGDKLKNDIFTFIKKNRGHSFFLTIFSSVIHFPYSPPYPYYKKFTEPNYYGSYKYFKFVDPTKSEELEKKDIEAIRNLFDSSVFAFDSEVDNLVSFLKKIDLYDSSIIILTGDHGESLFEDNHGHGHGEHLRGPYITQVPLIIKLPKTENKSYENKIFRGITSSIDILPTILDLYKIEAGKELPGKNLTKVFGKSDWGYDRKVYSETGIWFSDQGNQFFQKQRIMYPNILKLHKVVPEENHEIMITDNYYRDIIAFSKHRAIMTSDFKLIYIPTRDGVLYELYNRKTDPLNKVNLYGKNPIGESLRKELFQLVIEKEGAKQTGDYLLPPPF
ncbi:MAG: sulfatase-like hydrolase/transferase [Leptospiraceae bacterium]|nr:sulfatase-like hydrolase/transferase [Leptospiraceae bacterium]MCK6379966.1 sulfatase-like hydrolase/transferase [Leptospiraceae bacterium]